MHWIPLPCPETPGGASFRNPRAFHLRSTSGLTPTSFAASLVGRSLVISVNVSLARQIEFFPIAPLVVSGAREVAIEKSTVVGECEQRLPETVFSLTCRRGRNGDLNDLHVRPQSCSINSIVGGGKYVGLAWVKFALDALDDPVVGVHTHPAL
jgi:hypothetical protein